MDIRTIGVSDNKRIAVVDCGKLLIKTVQDAIDLIVSIKFEENCDALIIHKSAFMEDFFDLSTGAAGEILQKFTNYRLKVAIIGDYSGYTSKSLRDFICECNNGENIFFLSSESQAVERFRGLGLEG